MRVEDWSEPWVWRPEEWPGQPLTLKIVGNRHLAAGGLAGQPVHAALQLQRLEPRADDSHARRRGAARQAAESCSDRITVRCRRGRRRIRSRFRRTISRPRSARSRRPRAGDCSTPPTRRSSSTSTSSCTTFPPRSWTRAASPAPRTCRTDRTPPTCTRMACTSSRERIRTARRGTTRFCACCRRGDWEIRQRAADGCRAARSSRTSASREADFEFALGNVMRVTSRPARPVAAPSSGHALVSPALPRRDSRSGRQRPRRLPHRRRRRGRCDQSGDDRERAARSDREDRAVRLPRARSC